MPVIEESKTQRKVYAIFRCKAKDCKHTFRLSYEKTTIRTVSELPSGGMSQTNYRHSYVYPNGETRDYISNPLDCPKCLRQFSCYGKVVKGTLNPDKKCSAKCRGARGHNCECSCGGTNHGANY